MKKRCSPLWSRVIRGVVFLAAVSALSGCGGGGGGSSAATTPTATLYGGTMQGVTLNLAGTTSVYSGATTNPVNYNEPEGITTDGNYLYVADYGNNTITQINFATGKTVTLSNTSPNTSGLFNGPTGITTQDGQHFFVVNYSGNNVLKVTMPANGDFANASVSVLAGDGTAAEQDGTGSASSGSTVASEFNNPIGITTDGTNLYVTDWTGNTVRQVVIASGVVTTLVPSSSGLTNPSAITIIHSSTSKTLFVADFGNNVIRKISLASNSPPATMTTLAGSPSTTTLDQPAGLTTDGTYLYVADAGNYGVSPDIKRVDMQGNITTIVKSGSSAAVLFGEPVALVTDDKNLYAGDMHKADVIEIK